MNKAQKPRHFPGILSTELAVLGEHAVPHVNMLEKC